MRRDLSDHHSGSGLGLLLAAILVIGGGGAVFLFAGDRISDTIRDWLSSSSGGDLAGVPQPRSSAKAGATDLSEMPALVVTDAAKPESWPDLGPADLLAQSAALGDRALKETAFDQPPWRRFARPFVAPAGRPLLGLLITGLGADRGVTAAAIAGLPAEVTLSFSPYAADLGDWIAAARAFGHEAMVDLPLQTKDFPRRDPGPLGLLTGLNGTEAGRRIDAIAGSAPRVFGFAGDGGDALLLDDSATGIMLGEVARLGLSFIDTSGEPMSLTMPTAQQAGAPALRSSIVLDPRAARAAIAERLAAASDLAQEQGHAVAVAKVSPAVVTATAEWLRRLGDDGPALAPASALLQR